MEERTCTKCGETKPADAAHFNTSRPECKRCQSIYRRAYGQSRKAILNDRAAEYREQNRELLADKALAYRSQLTAEQRRQRNRAAGLKHAYGITLEQYDEMFMGQGGKCGICKRETDKKLAVDHDHETGRIRGLLCIRCNTALGTFGDNEAGLRAALAYLQGASVEIL